MSTRIVREIEKDVLQELSRLGLLFRAFSRAKDPRSVNEKISNKGYAAGGPLMQDFLGLRIALYFADDVLLVCTALRGLFGDVSETIDEPDTQTFKPARVNLVFSIPKPFRAEMKRSIDGRPIDMTFEVQVRTMLAEGWHEVEHDLRYKVPGDWDSCDDLSRALNGVVATLETCDWSMLQLFDELSYRHYQSGAWSSMVRDKFRMRFTTRELTEDVAAYLSSNKDKAKKIFRVGRLTFLKALLHSSIAIPLTLDNVVFAVNHLFVKDTVLCELTPQPISEIFTRDANAD